MAGGPRKFSEKIALLNQKEAEGNAAYASVMAQVVQIRPNDVVVNQQQQQQPPDSNKHQKLQHQQQQQQQQQYQQMMGPAPYLQLPTQPESFRRAQSDSSIHQSVNNMMNNNQMAPMMMPPQQQTQPQQQQQIMTNNTNNLPSPQQQQQQFNYMSQQQMYQQQQQAPSYQPNNFQQRPGGFQNGAQNDYNSPPQIPYRNFTLPILPNSTAGAPNETNSASASPAHSPHHFNSPPLSGGGGGHVSPTNFLHPKLPKNVSFNWFG